jgi:hypothetical protein
MSKKEKATKPLVVMTPPALHQAFEDKCREENRTVSEVIREFMSKYIQEWYLTPGSGLFDLRGLTSEELMYIEFYVCLPRNPEAEKNSVIPNIRNKIHHALYGKSN